MIRYSTAQMQRITHTFACKGKLVRKRIYMYKSHTRNAFTGLSKCICMPGETRLHAWQNVFPCSRMRYTLYLGGTVELTARLQCVCPSAYPIFSFTLLFFIVLSFHFRFLSKEGFSAALLVVILLLQLTLWIESLIIGMLRP